MRFFEIAYTVYIKSDNNVKNMRGYENAGSKLCRYEFKFLINYKNLNAKIHKFDSSHAVDMYLNNT